MSNGSNDPTTIAQQHIARVKSAATVSHDVTQDLSNDPLSALRSMAETVAKGIGESVRRARNNEGILLALDPLLTLVFTGLDEARKGINGSMGGATTSLLNDMLGTSFDPSVLTPAGGGDGTWVKANSIGTAVIGALEQQLAQARGGSGSPGGQAADTFMGFGLNLAMQNAIMSVLGSMIPWVHLDDLREIGDAVERSLGLGRLTRTAMHPLINTLIAEPYRQELNVKYSPEIMGIGDLVKAYLASRLVQDDVMDLARKQGLPDSQINELIEQGRLRLTAQEWNVLTAIGQQGSDPAAYDDAARGMDDDWIKLRQIVLTGQRLAPLVDRVLGEVLNQIKGGWIDTTSLEKYLSKYNLPQDEIAFWRDAAGALQDVPRKRLSEGQMLFLYEAAQIADDDVQAWAVAEGYSPTDQERLLTYFRLELIAKSSGVSAKQAAHIAALHTEHTAYITDEITGLWAERRLQPS